MQSAAIIIVSYNTRDMTLACLRSVFAQPSADQHRVIVLDNASDDGSAVAIEAEFGDRLELIKHPKNVGFAGGNNTAVEMADPPITQDWLLLLNPDTVVLDDAINTLIAFAQSQPDAKIYGGRTVFADRSLNPKSCWMRPTPRSVLFQALGLTRFTGSRLFNPEQPDAWARGRPQRVDIVSGCFFLIRKDLWNQLGGFDRDFFMYAEEADLCLRARSLGASPMVTDDATIVHYGGASEKAREGKLIRLLDAKCRLCRKHWAAGWLAGPLIALWPMVRLTALSLIALARPAKKADRDVWRAVWKARDRWLSNTGGRDTA